MQLRFTFRLDFNCCVLKMRGERGNRTQRGRGFFFFINGHTWRRDIVLSDSRLVDPTWFRSLAAPRADFFRRVEENDVDPWRNSNEDYYRSFPRKSNELRGRPRGSLSKSDAYSLILHQSESRQRGFPKRKRTAACIRARVTTRACRKELRDVAPAGGGSACRKELDDFVLLSATGLRSYLRPVNRTRYARFTFMRKTLRREDAIYRLARNFRPPRNRVARLFHTIQLQLD